MKAVLSDLAINLQGEFTMKVTTKDDDKWLEKYLELEGRPVEMKFTRWRNRRTEKQNAFFWVLMNKLADHYGVKANDFYLKFLRRYGRHFDLTLRPYDRKIFVERWVRSGLGNFCETLAPSVAGSPEVIRVWYGISDYTEPQLKKLIDILIAQCELEGVSTERPAPPEANEE